MAEHIYTYKDGQLHVHPIEKETAKTYRLAARAGLAFHCRRVVFKTETHFSTDPAAALRHAQELVDHSLERGRAHVDRLEAEAHTIAKLLLEHGGEASRG